jgi:polysaccharide export outer membrane protein
VATTACVRSTVAPTSAAVTVESSGDALERLRALGAERSKRVPPGSYRLGPGDLVAITVFKLPDMNRKVRVAESGDLQLPLIGPVRAAGRTEAELAAAIADTLSTRFLKHPQVDVFVEEYRSQQVAVTGAVSRPGLHPLTKDRYTILDMLSEAGGLTKEAGSFIEFVPADSPAASDAFRRAQRGEAPPRDGEESLAIDVTSLMRGRNRALLSLPVVAGDVIYVPEAGSFAIEAGWKSPGATR